MKAHRPSTSAGCRAFSLVELLVVLAVIVILAGLLVPQLLRARFNAKVTVCLSQYRQWGVAANVYATDDGKGRLPSFRLPTNQLSFIEPYILAHEMVTNLAPYGVGLPLWFCPTRPTRRWVTDANFRWLRGRELLTPADLVDEMTHVQRVNYYFGDLMWWVPRKLGETLEYPDPGLLQVRTPLSWPRRVDDPTVATQPMISDWYLGTWDADRQVVEIQDNSGGHQWAGRLRGLNAGFADGHVENRPRAQLKWQARRSGGSAYVY
ncbi:MAG: hypothetical protein RIS76_3559 [Verrucomicrobiota bacterium]